MPSPPLVFDRQLLRARRARAAALEPSTFLIERVAQAAQEHGTSTVYWLTQEDNARARLLYDKVGVYRGFIRYDYRHESAD